MLALLLIPVLVAGFVACHIHPLYFYKLHRYEGQYLYLKSAELGLKCFLIAIIIAMGLHIAVPESYLIFNRDINLQLSTGITQMMEIMGADQGHEATRMAWIFLLTVLTFLSAWILRLYGILSLKHRFQAWGAGQAWKIRAGVMGMLLEDSPLDRLLFSLSFNRKKLAMLSMKERKVYVGKVISLGEPSEFGGMDQEIRLVPFLIGYQDKDTLAIRFLEATPQAARDAGRYVILRQADIVSAAELDIEEIGALYVQQAREVQEPITA